MAVWQCDSAYRTCGVLCCLHVSLFLYPTPNLSHGRQTAIFNDFASDPLEVGMNSSWAAPECYSDLWAGFPLPNEEGHFASSGTELVEGHFVISPGDSSTLFPNNQPAKLPSVDRLTISHDAQ